MLKNREHHKRRDRKKEHIDFFMESQYKSDNLFDDIFIEHNALPELNFDDIDSSSIFLNKKIDYPIMIDAITGGTDYSKNINKNLANIAKKFNIPIAVGSQTIGLYDENSIDSFKIVRDIIGEEGIVLANLSANASIDEAKSAIDMIDADGIQLHLNPAQELVMKEGDREFKGILENIENVVSRCGKPVIVKEVGFGISKDVAKRLYDAGVRYIDVAGAGGTNFIEIENRRNNEMDFSDMYSWGIPTALSLLECMDISDDLTIIVSGGIRNSQEIIKSLCIGAKVVGMSGEILKVFLDKGYDGVYRYLNGITYRMKALMLLLGKKNIEELKTTPYRVNGELKDLLYSK